MMRNKIFLYITALLSFLSMAAPYSLADDRVVMTIDNYNVTVDEFLYLYLKNRDNGGESASTREYASLYATFRMKVMDAEAAGIDTTREFKSELEFYYSTLDCSDKLLRQEYRDGMLLFEISNRKIWGKSAEDTDALEKYFETHRKNYTWDSPRAKGWILYATTPEILASAEKMLDSMDCSGVDIRTPLLEHFGKEVAATRFLVKEGVNPVIDALVFNSGQGFEEDSIWKAVGTFDCRIITSPEEWNDVKGNVTSDYQEILSRNWEKELWNSHKVSFNYEIIDEVGNI